MNIGIINTGNIGRALARPWLRAGHHLFLAKDGGQTKLDSFIRELGGEDSVPKIKRGSPREAAGFGQVVLFSAYWPHLDATLAEVGDTLAGKVVIDTMNPLNVNERFEHTHDLAFMARSSTSEELQRRCPGARVIKAFSTLPAGVLDAAAWAANPVKPPIFVAGDDAAAKEVVFTLARDTGFEALDAGPLGAARAIEQLGVLLHQVGTHQFKGDYARLAPALLQAAAPAPASDALTQTEPPAAGENQANARPKLDTTLPGTLGLLRGADSAGGGPLKLADAQAIRETVLLSEWATDARRWDLLGDCLAADVVLDHAMGQTAGREAYLALLQKPGLLAGLRHLILNLVAWANPDGTATALHYVGLAKFADPAARGVPADLPQLNGLGLAELTLCKDTDGRWRITRFRNDQYVMSGAFLADADERARWALPRAERPVAERGR